MPLYEYFCDRCQKEVAVTQTMSEHANGAACPECGGTEGYPVSASTVVGQPDIMRIQLRCRGCGHEWVRDNATPPSGSPWR